MMVRNPSVAGTFYPLSEDGLRREVDRLLRPSSRRPAIAVVSPHAGYVYSGGVAGEVFSRVKIPERVVILGPKHTAAGADYALSPDNAWRTPLGDIEVDKEFGDSLIARCPFIRPDREAHRGEHSIEVQLPFLQYLQPRLRMTALALGAPDRERLREIGSGLAKEISAAGKDFLIVASSDLTHFEDQASAERKDGMALEAVSALDEKALWERVVLNRISMCGLLPVYVTLAAAKDLGAAAAEVVSYQTSGEVSGDFDSVVGYGGVVIQ